MLSWFRAGPLQGSIGIFLMAAAIAVLASIANPLAPAFAETYPERPIQMVIPAGPGSSTDTIMRSLAKFAAPLLGQAIVIFNNPGASGTIGVGSVARAPNDGYTIGGVWSGPITMAPHVA